MSNSAHPRLPRASNLDCDIAKRFTDRPTLLDAADQILLERWPEHLPDDEHDPLALYLASSHPHRGDTWVRPLSQVLVERYCQNRTLNLTPGDDYLTLRIQADPSGKLDVDLHSVERLINKAAPRLLEDYRQMLITYWSGFDTSGNTPWRWLADQLRGQLQAAIDAQRDANTWPGFILASAGLVHNYPDPTAHGSWKNTAGLKVSHLAVDFSADGKLDTDLASALLIEHSDDDPARNFTLLFTLAGKLHRFTSRQHLLESIGRYWPASDRLTPYEVAITPLSQPVFDCQALGLLDQQLRVITQLAKRYHSKLDALNMSQELDRLTSMLDFCSGAEATAHQALSEHLPEWLRNAQSRPLMRYSSLLLDVAQGIQDAKGESWLEGIDNAETFANLQLTERFAMDHPADAPSAEQVQIINYQTTASAAPVQGTVVTTGEVTPVSFTIAQLAIGNLGLLRPGRVELRSTTNTPLPKWFDESYLRTVISELDIATRYPAMLRKVLLDDTSQRQLRQNLLANQLRSQLPAYAQELYLRGKLPDQQAARHIAEVFWAIGDDSPRWVMRPLGFIKASGSTVDHPLNTWLIEPLSPKGDTCLLYRPLHEDTLLQFPDRLALFVAISTPGTLQDDMLQRLPEDSRRFYAHGGFLEPHLFVVLEDTSAVPFETPAPVKLTLEAPVTAPGEALYLACINESIAHFTDHASTTAQTRWANLKQLGWLLFNTLLPLAGGTLGKVAWLTQLEVALAEYADSDSDSSPDEQRLSLVNLLVNIATLLFSRSIFRLRLEEGELAGFPGPADAVEEATLPAPATPAVTSNSIEFDLNWSRPDAQLSATQQAQLQALKADIATPALGPAIPNGPLRGLYLVDDRLYANLGGDIYQAVLDASRNQMRIIGADLTPGPWLRQDEAGRWKMDLRLTLKGGMPLAGQLRRLQLDKESALRSVNELIRADKDAISTKIKEQTTIESLVAATHDDTILQNCQDKVQILSSFWTVHLERLRTRNDLEPVKDFKKVHAFALYQDSFCQRLLRKILQMRYQPVREQLLQVARQQQLDQDLSASDARIATDRLDRLAPLIDQMIDNNSHLRQCQDALNKLASLQQPEILQWRNLACVMPATAERDLILRFLRLEGLLNRLTLVHGLSGEAPYWRDRFWSNLELGIAQRAKLFKLPDPDQEVTTKLLRSIVEQLRNAARQLDHFVEHIEGDAALHTAHQLQGELDWIIAHVKEELAELPDYPPVNNLRQLRKKVPGLIETSDHGLLLAEPRGDDANTVDIPGPDSKAHTRTYHLKRGEWVELKPESPQNRPSAASLKRLLKDSDRVMEEARDECARLQRASTRYLPVELEESVNHQRERLLAHAESIESRLTDDNETDEVQGDKDAELVARNLRSLAEELKGKATELRTSAALAQPPRMGEVMFLVDTHQLSIRAVGTRTKLAKAKGRPADFLDEYSISHQGQVLWYAHFHYPAMSTAKADFTVGHLKTAAQRHMAGQRHADGSGSVVEVYRGPITGAAAARYFFNL
ncbi:DUF6543 domain-containing protein [Pseudomonas sp. CCOS 191]|uniref:DUF6543 domain-containing protein n=1 Tax=Pseudomonas sp. CCOS 191 TaxID=1649877 RepID=UPI00062449E6|nr:DUF6543 domain-containing protein [Pseudomonas sp. CCOS 191]CRI56239.1 hypothetical protein CCOS191_1703 [Pseudomonas sp. CCOS 191]